MICQCPLWCHNARTHRKVGQAAGAKEGLFCQKTLAMRYLHNTVPSKSHPRFNFSPPVTAHFLLLLLVLLLLVLLHLLFLIGLLHSSSYLWGSLVCVNSLHLLQLLLSLLFFLLPFTITSTFHSPCNHHFVSHSRLLVHKLTPTATPLFLF